MDKQCNVTVNLTDERREALVENLCECMDALNKAKAVMRKNIPHGVNYPNREAWEADRKVWLSHMDNLSRAWLTVSTWADEIANYL